MGSTHTIDAPCLSADAGTQGPDIFYAFGFDRRVFLYADTFGATWDTVLYLLDGSCTPIATSTMAGDAVCSVGACGTQQSQVVAVLDPGDYVLGLSGAAGAEGEATIHFAFAPAGGGTISQLPQGTTVESGVTSGVSDITDVNSSCIAAGPENSYWWANCPADPAGLLSASTCGGATWETDLELEVPPGTPYQCSKDGCASGLQTTLNAHVPAGSGLRVLVIDGETANDQGEYTMQVTRP